MKVLIVNLTDGGSGAGIAALRLTEKLNEYGITAHLGVVNKQTNSEYSFILPKKSKYKIIKIYEKIYNFIKYEFYPITKRLNFHFNFQTTNNILHTTNSTSETDIDWINNSDYDIINLHWINGVICNKDISKIKKPIIWTMHDSWPCCGAEHHPNIIENDTRWKEGYYRYNRPKTTKGIDLCRKVWLQKKKYLSNKNITFIAPSNWEHDILKSSKLFGDNNCFVIPNIIDNSVFYPKNKKEIRQLFRIPEDKIVLGFGAAYDIDNPKSMKGSYYLIEALKQLENPEKYFLIVFGPASNTFANIVNIPTFISGFISNPNILSCLYSACDCIINPSLIENLPNICLESIACGVPVVAFDVGGTSDIVVHQITGYLAKPYNTKELVNGIYWRINNKIDLTKNCRDKINQDFNTDKTIKKIIKLYENTLIN